MVDFKIDSRKLKFLNDPEKYIKVEPNSGLQKAPLTRQFKTAKAILERFKNGHGVLLADDVGLGKTTVGALVAWVVACQGMRVRIYAPNKVLRRRWEEELARHVPMLSGRGADEGYIKAGGKLFPGRIIVATHDTFIKKENSSNCDVMIIDEAHRAKGEDSDFKAALLRRGDQATRKLILTATPFSINLAELQQLLSFVGAPEMNGVSNYADALQRLYSVGDGQSDVATESRQLVSAAQQAIDELKKYVIRHDVDNLSSDEQKHFGTVEKDVWKIASSHAGVDDVKLLLRMDRLLQLAPPRVGARRNDPRFHIGWQHVRTELDRAKERCDDAPDSQASKHVERATIALELKLTAPHPKMAAVSDAIREVVDKCSEKVLVFCHHRATANELVSVLEHSLRVDMVRADRGPTKTVWRAAWDLLLPPLFPGDGSASHKLIEPILDWLCSPGLRQQIGGWIGEPASDANALAKQLKTIRPRNASGRDVPTIFKAAEALTKALLSEESKSTLAILRGMLRPRSTTGKFRLPGCLDDGLRVMGAWESDDAVADQLKTLYTGQPDIVIALFNSPFGPDVLVTTDRLSEGVDLHRCCRHLIHYELDPSPVRTLQRNGRIRRVGSWAALTKQPIRYAYPTFVGTRDEKAVEIMRQRVGAFGLLLGGVPSLNEESAGSHEKFAAAVLREAAKELAKVNGRLCVGKK
jgi:SNF2-related domain/Helicase conserved C-terminal domain